MKQIPLTQGKFTIVDDEDYEYLMQWKWYALKRSGGFTAVRKSSRKHGRRKRILLMMHRVIMKCPDTLEIDHIHHVTLDNRKSELRICTHQENSQNRLPQKNRSSRFKGVSRRKGPRKWRARIILRNKHEYLGSFTNEIDAARAYDKRAFELFGAFARCNFIRKLA